MSTMRMGSALAAVGALLILAGPGQAAENQAAASESAHQHPAAHQHEQAATLASSPSPSDGQAIRTGIAGPTMQKKLQERLATEYPGAPYAKSGMSHMMSEGVPLHGSMPGMVSLLPHDHSVETVSLLGGACPPGAPSRSYNVSAINVQITMNKFLDYDPLGRMYVLTEDITKVRNEEQQNANARADLGPPAVTTGLQGDAIQPLAIRANKGDCLTINFSNNLSDGDSASIHLHNSSMIVVGANVPAIASNPAATAAPGGSVTYQWYIAPETQEGTFYFHSHSNMRPQTSHGLFGAVIVENAGSAYLDPWTGAPLKSGWLAIIQPSSGPSFREFAIFYHEVGNDNFRHNQKNNTQVVMGDFLTDAYKWGGRALNYRSEPFRRRMELINARHGFIDESESYGSYTNGDPPTPIPRTYLGDPVKWRLIHGGSEVWHVHHLHGGSIRWKRQSETGDTRFDVGLSKFPPMTPDVQEPGRPAPSFSDYVDAQSIGPSETFDEENECGSGGCQQVAGDHLWHCHVAHHYLGGMWSFWRVYNTLQNGAASTDTMPALRELPDRTGKIQPAVTSDQLVGKTVDWFSNKSQNGISGTQYSIVTGPTNPAATPAQFNIADWVEMQLPPQGKPGNAPDEANQILAYDATVIDWMKVGNVYLNEPETTQTWVNYAPQAPGARFPIKFDPVTGKVAYPWLRPHLGKRHPFAPNHGPAPYLEPIHRNADGTNSSEPAQPGENGLWSLCPANSPENPGGTPRKFYNIHMVPTAIPLNAGDGLVDPDGKLFVLAEERAAMASDDSRKVPLAIRASTRDCVDVIYSNELNDDSENFFLSKTNLHIHFVQFDPQGSDGVTTGLNYEGSMRPFHILGQTGMQQPMNTTLAVAAPAGATSITVADASRFHLKTEIGIGMEQNTTLDIRRIVAIAGTVITINTPLTNSHGVGEFVSVEWVRSRWYADAQTGATYFHDHTNGIRGWKHGQFAVLVVEPVHSTYHDPTSGNEIRSGILADIHTSERLTTDVVGSFRELVMLLQDDNPVTKTTLFGGAQGSSLNLRVEPLPQRFASADPAYAFSSHMHGDPETHILRAYTGDPVVVRLHQTGQAETHTWHLDGHWYRGERFSPLSLPKDTQHIGIAERYDLVIPHAGGPQKKPGDYLFQNARRSKVKEGSWGIMRVLGQGVGDLQNLPGRTIASSPGGVCPPSAPVKAFSVSAINVPLTIGPNSITGRVYALNEDVSGMLGGTIPARPMVLHINVGDCLTVAFTNQLAGDRASFHVDMMAFDPLTSYGANVGQNPLDQSAGPGEQRNYVFYAHPEFGTGGALIRDYGDPLDGPRNGLFGAIVIGPTGSKYYDPFTGADVSKKSRVSVDVVPPTLQTGVPVQIGGTLCAIQSILGGIPILGPLLEQLLQIVTLSCTTPENTVLAVNVPLFKAYRDYSLFFQDEDELMGIFSIPYVENVAGVTGVNYKAAPFSTRMAFGPDDIFRADLLGDPPTPILQAYVGDPVMFHVFGASNEQNQVFTIENHEWPLERFMPGSDLLGSAQFGAEEALNVVPNYGAGGNAQLPGNYLWLNHRQPYTEAGQWGYFRVCGAVPLPGSPTCNVRVLATQGILPPLPLPPLGILGL
jgi:hypothetical protein